MAQHDYIIANQSGLAFRQDLNNALAAIVSQNSGAAEPSTTYAYQFWADTTAGVLKIRNASNNGWITLRELDGTLTIEDGTAGAPGLAFADDLNTGLFSGGNDQLGITTGGVERVGISATAVVFNDGGADVDFRVEGDTEANLLFVDAGNDEVSFRDDVKVDSSGRLLVGTSTARANYFNSTLSAALQVEGTGHDSSSVTITKNSNDGAAPTISLAKSRGTTVGSNTVVQNGDDLGYLAFQGSDGSEFVGGAYIYATVDGNPGANDLPTRLSFSTTADGASSPTERMRITNLGRIGLNATDPGTSRIYVNAASSDGSAIYGQKIGSATGGNVISGYSAPAAGASGTHYGVNGSYVAQTGVPGGGTIGILSSVFGILGYYDTANSWGGYFNGSTYATGSYQGSDARLKDVIEPISGGILDKLASIQPVRYKWKENTDQRETVGDGIQIGLIAQEVEEHFPELVKEVTHSCPIDLEQLEEGQFDSSCSLNHELGTFKTLEYQHLTAVLVEALKEAKTRIETLEAKVAALETPNS